MGIRQKQRGAETEREVCARIAAEVGWTVQRQLGQARDGGCDIKIAQYFIEVKRRKKIAIYEWMDQAVAATQAKSTALPVVICRADKRDFLVIQPLSDWLKLIKPELPEK